MDSSSYQQNNPSDDNNDPSRNNNNNNDDESRKKNDSSSKKGKGRKKIPMEKIKSETNRKVTFSKRRVGVFKKASELHTLCGADNAIAAFSPSGKAYSFAAGPNIQTITDQLLALGGTSSSRFINQQMHDNPIIRQRNAELTGLERQLRNEKRKKKEHARTRNVKKNQIDYPPNIDLLDMNQLQSLKDSLLGLKNALATTVNCGGGGVGPAAAAPMDPNTLQGPPPPSSNNNNINIAPNHQFYYGNNGAMLNGDMIGPEFVPDHDVYLNNNYDQTSMFVDFGVTVNNNTNGVAPFLPPGAMVTNNQYGHFDQTTNNSAAYHQFPPRPNDAEVGGSSSLVFLNNEGEARPNQDGAEDAGEARPGGGGPNINAGYGSGFNNNYNNFGGFGN